MLRFFELSEFECKCCQHEAMSVHFLEQIDRLRYVLDGRIIITSGYRCPKHNKAVGGADNSLHTKGLAIDFFSPDKPLRALEYLLNSDPDLSLGGIGLYDTWIHWDRGDWRGEKEVRRWDRRTKPW